MEDELLTIEQAAAALGIKPGSIRDQIVKGKITPIRIGGRGERAGMLFVHRSEIERYRRDSLGRRKARTSVPSSE